MTARVFVRSRAANCVTSSSPMFRPLQTKVGPDGAIYFCDWCNPIIGHYQASYRDPQRDHTHGRIWRMAYKGGPAGKAPALHKMSPAELIDQLASPERWVRQQAKEFLYRLPTEAVVRAADARLAAILAGEKSPGTAEPGVKFAGAAADADTQAEHLLYELTGVFAAHEAVRPALIERLLDFNRAAAARVRHAYDRSVGRSAARPLGTADADDRRRFSSRADGSGGRGQLCAIAGRRSKWPRWCLNKPRDRLIDYALTETVLTLKSQWYPALEKGELSFDNQPDRVAFVLAADGTTDVAKFVRQLSEKPELTDDARAPLWALLAKAGGPDDLRYALDHGARYPVVLDELAVGGLAAK